MVRVMLGMLHRVVLGRMVMMFFSLQFMTVGLLGVMRFGLMVVFLMRPMGFPMMVGGGIQMMGGLFVMIMLRHLSPPGRF
jgi:hypothetical protein